MANIKAKFFRLTIIIAATIMVALFFADRIIVESHLAAAHEKVRKELQEIESRLTFNLYNNIQIVRGLPALFAVNPSLSQQDFALATDSMLDGHNQLRNIAAAPNLVIRYMHPMEGNEKAIGVDYHTLPHQIDSVLQAKNSRDIVLAGPVTLIQGGQGIISRAPVFLKNDQGIESFWGIVSSVIDANLLYEASGLLNDGLPLEISIRGRDGLGMSGEVFFGEPELFNQQNITSTITLPNGSWQIAAKPIAGWPSLLADSTPKRLIPPVIGLALFLVLLLTLRASMNAATANLKFRNLLAGSPVPYALYNDKLQITYLNNAFVRTFGYTLEDIPALDDWWPKAYPDPTYREHVQALWNTYIEDFQSSNENVAPVEVIIHCKNGSTRTVLASLAEINAVSSLEYPVALYDITKRKQAEAISEQKEEQLLSFYKAGLVGLAITSPEKSWIRINSHLCEMLEYSEQELNNMTWDQLTYPDDLATDVEQFTRLLANEIDSYSIEKRYVSRTGKIIPTDLVVGCVRDQNGKVEYLTAIVQDITKRKQTESYLIEAEKRLQLSQSAGGIGTWEANLLTNKIVWSDAVTQQLGFPDISDPTWQDFINTIHPDDRRRVLKKASQHIKQNQSLDIEYRITDQSKKVRWIRSVGKAELDADGYPITIRGTVQEITREKAATEKLNQMAHYDVLTQLPNRTLLLDRFNQAIAHSKRSDHQLAVCFLDLDKFKLVNDTFGHEIGDLLLQQVGNRILDTVREEDTVSRQGGDEFALLLGEIESYTACEQFVIRLLNTISQPYLIDGVSHQISASCGITLYPADNADLDTLLRHADHAMYQAKQAGRNRHHLFSVEHDEQVSEKHQQLAEIQRALANKEFSLYYQPKVHMKTGEVFGAEALIRWIHPEKGLITPFEFLPILEGTELELQVGDWVIRHALKQLAKWNNMGIKLEVSVNISSHHLLSTGFFKQLECALAKYPTVQSQSLQLEILESSALGDLDSISRIIKTCQDALGVQVALDDFGTGYSSLTHIRNLSANTIKIDQSFVRDMLHDASDFAIIEGVIGLAKAFNRNIIAEGVETTEHGLMLLIMGCHDAQGYGIAKPMPADDLADWLTSYQPNQEWLKYSNKSVSIKENKVFLFNLIIDYWLSRLTENILADPENISQWPNFEAKQGLSYLWLQREKQDSLFRNETLIELEQARKECLILAHSIQLKYLDGKIESARQGLNELQAAFEKMDIVLQQHEENTQAYVT